MILKRLDSATEAGADRAQFRPPQALDEAQAGNADELPSGNEGRKTPIGLIDMRG